METNGAEIKGMCKPCLMGQDKSTPDFNLTNPVFEIKANLIARDCSVSIDVTQVKYLGGIDGNRFAEIFDGIIERKMKPILQKGIKDAINYNQSRIARELRPILGEGCVRSVRISGDNIFIDR